MRLITTINSTLIKIKKIRIKWKVLLIVYALFAVILGLIFASELPSSSDEKYKPLPEISIKNQDPDFELGIDVLSIHGIDVDSRTFSAKAGYH